MNPTVTGVTERNVLSPNGVVSKAVVLTYKVGTYGPFTLVTTQQDIASGAAAQAMQQFASSLATLPTVTS